ncbi:MAG: GDP-mannose 4,6-dehydratase [Rhodospirillaceae bacterium]
MTKALVLGSNSFSGATFVSHLLEQGLCVFGASRSPEPHDAFLPYKWNKKSGDFQFHQLDINKDLDAIEALIRQEKITHVINFAAQGMVAESWRQPEQWFMTNTVSTIKFHNCIRKFDFLERYLHVTTPEVYGSTENFIDETTPFNPSTPYAVSRAAADMSLKSFYDAYEFPVLSTRAANVFGPGQQLYRIIPRTILFCKLGKKLQLHGGGTSERSFIHMNDVARGTFKILMHGSIGETYHISTDDIISIRALVEMICERMGINFNDAVEVADERLGKDASYQLSSSKLRTELNWTDKILLEDGISETIAWVEQWLDDLTHQPHDYIHKA